MPSHFSKGVTKSSTKLQEIRESMSDLISMMEAKVDLHTFDMRHPDLLHASIADIKEARKLIYRALERLNFPDKFSGSQNGK